MKIKRYINTLNLQTKSVTKIEHEDSVSSDVYKIKLQNNNTPIILKICYNAARYKRELFFLQYAAQTIPVPKIIDTVEPTTDLQGAILMQCLPGEILNPLTLTSDQSFKMGALLATLHNMRTKHYGDLTDAQIKTAPAQEILNDLYESIKECTGVVDATLLEQAKKYVEKNINVFENVDGPCITHRDFKPGNVFMHHGKISGLIDWECAKSSFAEEDFLRMDRFVWNRNGASKKYFLNGYASVRNLPDLERVMPILRLTKTLSALGFYVARNSWKTTHKKNYENNLSFLQDFLKIE